MLVCSELIERAKVARYRISCYSHLLNIGVPRRSCGVWLFGRAQRGVESSHSPDARGERHFVTGQRQLQSAIAANESTRSTPDERTPNGDA